MVIGFAVMPALINYLFLLAFFTVFSLRISANDVFAQSREEGLRYTRAGRYGVQLRGCSQQNHQVLPEASEPLPETKRPACYILWSKGTFS